MIVASMTYMSAHERVLHRGRSFYGAHRVTLDPSDRYRVFVDGGIVHGAQSTDPARRREPMTYFHKNGPIGQVFAGRLERRVLEPAERLQMARLADFHVKNATTTARKDLVFFVFSCFRGCV
jgi:hypothetical protein